jgi:hypothetical protein
MEIAETPTPLTEEEFDRLSSVLEPVPADQERNSSSAVPGKRCIGPLQHSASTSSIPVYGQ